MRKIDGLRETEREERELHSISSSDSLMLSGVIFSVPSSACGYKEVGFCQTIFLKKIKKYVGKKREDVV